MCRNIFIMKDNNDRVCFISYYANVDIFGTVVFYDLISFLVRKSYVTFIFYTMVQGTR